MVYQQVNYSETTILSKLTGFSSTLFGVIAHPPLRTLAGTNRVRTFVCHMPGKSVPSFIFFQTF